MPASEPRSAIARYVENTPNGTEIPDESFRNRHRGILLFTAAILPLVFAISRLTGVESVTGAELPAIPMAHSLAGTGLVAALLLVAAVPLLPRRLRSALAAFAFMTVAAVLAYFTGGFIEAHFLYFVGVGVVALYEDWVPFGITIGYVATQHSVFGLIEWFTVYNHPAAMANPVVWGGIHAVGVLMLATAITFLWQSLAIQRQQAREAIQEKLDEVEEAKRVAEDKQQEAARQKEEMTALNQALEATATEFQTTMRACADGDLTQRLDDSVDNDAMASIARAFNDMIDDVERTVLDIQSFAERVSSASTDVADRSTEIKRTSIDVEESVSEVAARAEEQDEQLQTVAGEIGDLSATVEEIASSSEEVAATAGTAVDRGNEGREHAGDATDEIAAIESRADAVAEEITALNEQMDEIVEIADVIRGITEQTNILALNASIEAANADASGDGFAVVANEVKSLAEEASVATDDIERRIENAREVTDGAVTSIEAMTDRVETGADTIDETISMFDDIAAAIEEAEGGIAEISSATDDQAASAEEIASMVDDVSETSQSTARESTDVAEQTASQVESLEETLEDAQELATMASDLTERVESFDTTERDPDDRTGSATGVSGGSGNASPTPSSAAPARPDGGRD
ncbi:transducer protein Htr8 [Natronomonas moolapensis 8.8.11]|uniref:Transducer protein Htr8 n=1 Tax=Natronomonas moolapensis (strain DSM 18674 / CECT 7526 / JCM 14361 / 8.8.11) TaxID=268739 RepID=M1XSV4_NATM8|nr:methyl-accepting chemotaxis protein [Natronomonas moolapensis]CCQ37480.1 transducer protein Htr8 [Natronomonas moolapensis 8.8.11]